MNQQVIGKIFIVDDDAFWSQLLEKLLENNGFSDIEKFESGAACLEKLHHRPGLILLDYSMATLNGIEVLRKIKRFDPDIFVIFISSQEDIEVAVKSLKYGAFDYIVKGESGTARLPKVLDRLAAVKEVVQKQKRTSLKNIFSFR